MALGSGPKSMMGLQKKLARAKERPNRNGEGDAVADESVPPVCPASVRRRRDRAGRDSGWALAARRKREVVDSTHSWWLLVSSRLLCNIFALQCKSKRTENWRGSGLREWFGFRVILPASISIKCKILIVLLCLLLGVLGVCFKFKMPSFIPS